jgi:hypothetical protein
MFTSDPTSHDIGSEHRRRDLSFHTLIQRTEPMSRFQLCPMPAVAYNATPSAGAFAPDARPIRFGAGAVMHA